MTEVGKSEVGATVEGLDAKIAHVKEKANKEITNLSNGLSCDMDHAILECHLMLVNKHLTELHALRTAKATVEHIAKG